jgi:hypothetical protein
MCDFTTATTKQVPPAPNQRVNYPLGLVLGADEFEQEQAYFLDRDRQHNRAGHGYGTVCGLNLSINDSEVSVSPGLAIDPHGRVIVICKDQCGDVNDWLSVAGNRDLLGVTSGAASLYVTLSYRECLTNKVPIPGAPCRSEEDTMDYSRVTESFNLEFHVDPPPAAEVQAGQGLARLLAQIQITDVGTDFLDEAAMADLVRGLLETSPLASPPAGPLLLKPADAGAVMRTAFRVWVNEVRPVLRALCDEAAQTSKDGDCILLGRVDFSVNNATGLTEASPKPEVHQEDRPFLLHAQLIQELVLETFWGLSRGLFDLSGDVTGPIGTNTVEAIRGTAVAPAAPAAGQVLLFKGGQWVPSAPPAIPLRGDVGGTSGASIVQRLRGTTVAATAPKDGQVLAFFDKQWKPRTTPYIVAAGIVSVSGNVDPVFGAGLQLVAVANKAGSLLIQFKEYEEPTSKFTYIVKAMAVCNGSGGLLGPVVSFDQFRTDGIRIWVTDSGNPVKPVTLAKMQFMIEISRYQSN